VHFEIACRSERPKRTTAQPYVIDELMITERNLSACVMSVNRCLELVPSMVKEGGESRDVLKMNNESIVDERIISADITGSRSDARSLINSIHRTMASSFSSSSRRPVGRYGFLDSNYFARSIAKLLPRKRASKKLHELSELSSQLRKKLGRQLTVKDVLTSDSNLLRYKTRLSSEDVITTRRILMGIPEKDAGIKFELRKGVAKSAKNRQAKAKKPPYWLLHFPGTKTICSE
jgi:hypothetical protein